MKYSKRMNMRKLTLCHLQNKKNNPAITGYRKNITVGNCNCSDCIFYPFTQDELFFDHRKESRGICKIFVASDNDQTYEDTPYHPDNPAYIKAQHDFLKQNPGATFQDVYKYIKNREYKIPAGRLGPIKAKREYLCIVHGTTLHDLYKKEKEKEGRI